jgi:biotin carboxyl carrier protein
MPNDLGPDVFRQEALDHYHRPRSAGGEVLMMLPGWARWTYRLILALVLGAVVFVVFGSVSKQAEGPAVIRAEGRIAVTATGQGIVASVPVVSGARVKAGDVVVRFRSSDESAQVASIEQEFESALVRMLANPLDQAARQTVAGLRAQKELLAARLDERSSRAPVDGTVGDIRVRAGQVVSPGDVLASIAGEAQRFSVVALMPGRQRPDLRKGQPLRLEMGGYAYVYQHLTIDRIDDEVVGPQEVRRMLGREIADAIAVTGPVVVVHASLPSTTFETGGRTYGYFDGMHGTARVQLRSERLITTLLPSMKVVTEGAR